MQDERGAEVAVAIRVAGVDGGGLDGELKLRGGRVLDVAVPPRSTTELSALLEVGAAAANLSTGDLCDRLVAELTAGSDLDDDCTVLAIRFAPSL